MIKKVISIVFLMTVVIGCGFKGPLYLPTSTKQNNERMIESGSHKKSTDSLENTN